MYLIDLVTSELWLETKLRVEESYTCLCRTQCVSSSRLICTIDCVSNPWLFYESCTTRLNKLKYRVHLGLDPNP